MSTSTSVLAFVSVLAIGCSNGAPQRANDSSRVTIALNWIPDSQHGGFYAAKQNGFYRNEGLDVTILPGGPNAPVIQQVATGRADFGVGNSDQILLARQQDADVVAVMAAMQNSPRCIMVRENSGIDTFEKLSNVRLALGAGKSFAEFLKRKVPLKDVTLVPYTGSIAPFLNDERFAQQAYVFSEPHVAEQRGVKTTCLMVSDLGFNPYASCLFAKGETIENSPELVEKIVRATRKGWWKYLESSTATNKLIQNDNPAMEMASLEFGASAMRELCLPSGSNDEQLGQMDAARWKTMAEQLVELKFLDSTANFESAFTTRFLKAMPTK